jgi:sugar/nucleoside kinase (ribokinase family)
MVAITQCGGSAIYTGKVAHDTHGEFYRRDLQDSGVGFHVPLAPEAGFPTGTCVVLTTPDAERTMCTHLGISTALSEADIDEERLAQCKFSYIEGYLWDAPQPRSACVKTFQESRRLGIPAAFTFSDPWLVDRFANEFKSIVRDYCDILFCNSDEARRFFEAEDIDQCVSQIGNLCELVFVTASERGCYVIRDGVPELVAGFPTKAIDTVGAGDAFAGGTLYGLARGMSPQDAARLGNYLASRVVATIGPRIDIKKCNGPIRDELMSILN